MCTSSAAARLAARAASWAEKRTMTGDALTSIPSPSIAPKRSSAARIFGASTPSARPKRQRTPSYSHRRADGGGVEVAHLRTAREAGGESGRRKARLLAQFVARRSLAHHAEGALEGRGLRLGARVLEERRKVKEDGLDVRQRFERTAQDRDAMPLWVGVARAQPAVRGDADASRALAHERDRLAGREQRGRPALGLNFLENLPPHEAELGRLRAQPRDAHERDVAALQRLDQPVVERRERLEDVGGQIVRAGVVIVRVGVG
eukprot:1433997-Prymnesium_polylepis.1